MGATINQAEQARVARSVASLREDPRFADVLVLLRARLADERDTYEETTASEFVRGKIVALRELEKELTGAPP